MTGEVLRAEIGKLADEFARERRERQVRRELAGADFHRLRDAGFLLTAVPREHGGLWEDAPRSIRLVSDVIRTLAHGDPSVALVCSMHPGVLAIWLTTPEAPAPCRDAWAAQRRHVFDTAREGAWWGTIVSEPGTGGDITRTRAVARQARPGDGYLVTGQKSFGSGSGIMSYMVPYGFWLQDVRSLGFLRPTWGVAYDRLLEGSWALAEL